MRFHAHPMWVARAGIAAAVALTAAAATIAKKCGVFLASLLPMLSRARK